METENILPVYGMDNDLSTFKAKIILVFISSLTIIIILLSLGLQGVIKVQKWNEVHYLATHSLIETESAKASFSMRFNLPVTIEERDLPQSPVVLASINANPTESDVEQFINSFTGTDKEIVRYICEKWGVMKCETAVAIAKSENFWNKTKSFAPDRYNINTNGTIDAGIFMINTVHFNKAGCSLAEIVDWKKNIDCAYALYQEQAFEPWVAFTTGRYAAHLTR